MIRQHQLGLPTWFMFFSSADTHWPDLLKILGKLVDQKDYTYEEIQNLDWDQKTRLLQADPVTASRFFDHRVQQFFKTVLNNHPHPLGQITDYFIQVEFQHRGSPHVHILLWIKDAPKLGHDPP